MGKIGKRVHKWLGIPLCFLLFMSALSGILLNHRDLLLQVNIPRWLLPKSYEVENWNNAALRGIHTEGERHYLYGISGIWRTEDSSYRTAPYDYNQGLDSGNEYRRIVSMASDSLGRVWAMSQFALYREKSNRQGWEQIALPLGLSERLSDFQVRGDSLVLLSRSHIYTRLLDSKDWHKYELPRAQNHVEGMLLFQLVWMLHSGEYFGLAGRIVVDCIGLIVILLSFTGIIYSCTNYRLRSKSFPLNADKRKSWSKVLSKHISLHNAWGKRFFFLLLFVAVTGWMLRPPLMLGLVYHRLVPWRISHLYSENPWHDRLRILRYDEKNKCWLMHTSVGFYTLSTWSDTPKRWKAQPPVSPMGINVMGQRQDGEWLVGSFSGLFSVRGAEVRDYFTGEVKTGSLGAPFGAIAISGGRVGQDKHDDKLFSYRDGAISYDKKQAGGWRKTSFCPLPSEINKQPFSLWQWALEVHTGRIYSTLIGGIGVILFIFLLGLSTVLVLITGYRRLSRTKSK